MTRRAIPLLFLCGALAAQQPVVKNARVETRDAGGGLAAALRSAGAGASPAWVGYQVPVVAGHHSMCCWNNNAMCACNLEPGSSGQTTMIGENSRTVKLEGATELIVLLRFESGRVGKVRNFTPDCELDAGGVAFYWLVNVKSAESIAYLAGLAHEESGGREERRLGDSAVAAIAFHSDPSADPALEELASPAQSEGLRRKAIFWLGEQRGRRGFEIVSHILRADTSDRIREEAIFALTQSHEPGAMPEVIRTAHDDPSPEVRSKALFWIAQRAGRQLAEKEITSAIENDPETKVKKQAVFALSQLPRDEGVPLLINVAKNNRNPDVRKQAMFWLGQSKDPRALSFFEALLTK